MKRIFPVLLSLMVILAFKETRKFPDKMYKWPRVTPPVADINPYTRTLHEDTVVDNYFWMIDYFKKGRDSSKVVKYLEAENDYLDTMMSGTKDLQQKLFTEMKSRIKEKDESVPVFKNGYYYYTRTETGKQYFKYCRKKGTLTAPEEILLDIDEMAAGHPYYAAAGFNVSEDNKLLAYGVDTVSRRQYVLHFKNLETGEIYKDAVHNTNGQSVWANDNKTLFYTANNPVTLLSEKIKRHKLHADEKHDVAVYEEKDKSNYLAVGKSKSGKYIAIYSGGTLSSETRFIPADEPNAVFKVFQPRMKEVLYNITALDDKFLILTNWKAKNFRLMKCPADKTDISHWKEVIPHRKDVLLSDIEDFKNFLVLTERKNGLIQLRIRDLKNNRESYLDFGEPAYAANVGANPEYNTTTLRYNYTSLTTPSSVYDYNMITKQKS